MCTLRAICARTTRARRRLWQFKAREIDHDREQKLLEFRDATLEIDGWPVFYTPYISAPDPSVKRASGFLMPGVGNSNNNGFHISLPYYWAIDVDKDLTLAPRFMTKGGPLLATEYRQRFGNGALDAVGSINYSDAQSATDTQASDRLRGHINATGVWDLDETYRTGFDLQRVSDQTYLLRYGFGVPLLNAMISRAYLQGFEPRAMTDVFAYAFQPLLPGLSSATQPIVLPVANRDLGQRTRSARREVVSQRQSAEHRPRDRNPDAPDLARQPVGTNIPRRYRRTIYILGEPARRRVLGQRSEPDLQPRSAERLFPAERHAAGRTDQPQLCRCPRPFRSSALTWSYPLAHRGPERTAIVEPIVGTYVAPAGGNQRRIPNEDSLGFEFRDVDLFRPDRLAGYDVLDTGQRVDYGLKLGLYDKIGGDYRLLIGQSYRAQPNPFLPLGSGATERLSDVVGRVRRLAEFLSRPDLPLPPDKSDLSRRTQEVGMSAGPQNLRVGANYLYAPPQSVQPSRD